MKFTNQSLNLYMNSLWLDWVLALGALAGKDGATRTLMVVSN